MLYIPSSLPEQWFIIKTLNLNTTQFSAVNFNTAVIPAVNQISNAASNVRAYVLP